MRPVRTLVARELEWTQPSALRRQFELRDGEEVVATLDFRSAIGSFATARTGDGSWTFKRVGFWAPRVTVCVEGTDQEIATFHNHTWKGGGTITLTDGRLLRASTNFWMSTYELAEEQGEPFIRYHKVGGVFHQSARVEVLPDATRFTELPWLLVLCWYLAVLLREDAAASGAAAS